MVMLTSLVNAMTNHVFFGFPFGGCCACPTSSDLDGALEAYSGVGQGAAARGSNTITLLIRRRGCAVCGCGAAEEMATRC